MLKVKNKIGAFGNVLVKFASAQVISNFLRLISGFLVVRLLEPSIYGQYTGVGVYLGYILLGQGGIINGLGRELPFELGKGNDKFSRQLASSVFTLTIFVGFIASIIFISLSIYYFIANNILAGWIYLSYSILGMLYLLNSQFLPVLYRTNNDFNSLSKQNLLFGFGNLVTVLLVYFFSIYGLMIRGILLSTFQFYLLFSNKPYELDFKIEFKDLKRLFKTGLPIFSVGYVNTLWSTIINSILFSFGGAVAFGLYALSTIVENTLKVIPTSFSGVIYPRMSIMYGKGMGIQEIIKSNIKPLFFQFIVMLIISLIGYYLLPIFVPIFLPNYIEGIEAAQWMLFVPVVLSFGAVNHIYNVTKKQFWYFISLFSGVLIGTIYILISHKIYGFSLVIFPQGLLLGKLIQQILSILLIRKLIYDERKKFK